MSHDLHETSICRSPHAFINKKGEAILVELLDENHHQRLIDMYLRFEPRNSFGGLPPADDNSCVAWVNGMIADATNLVALSFDEGIVGHLALFPINSRRCELLVVVSPAYQNTGIGTRLVRCSTQLAYEIDFEQIWLSVEMANKRARHVYKKCGFRCLDRPDVGEVDMGLDLRQYEDAVSVHVEQIMDRNAVSICEGTPCRTALEVLLREEVASHRSADPDARRLLRRLRDRR